MTKKTLISGIQPTGKLHLGNYFGAMKQMVELQNKYDSSFFIADLHALTTISNPQELRENTLDVYLSYLAIGLDPQKVFKQSDAPQVAELAWIFSNLVTVPWLERAHSFKDKVAKGIAAGVGLFNYPILMAADILISGAEVVPVGKDQQQHVEMAREIARKFNQTYGEFFAEPQELIKEETETVPGIDGEKMSKSYKNTIPLFASREELQALAMSVVTSSAAKGEPVDPDSDNVYKLYQLAASQEEVLKMAKEYQAGELGFKEAKERLGEALDNFITPMREQFLSIDRDKAQKQLEEAGKIINQRYEEKMKEIRKLVGLS